ncbi:MAG: His/Gly/Thr/Pro-type tRNA ligase C-terminal domain-containing protein, partial [Alphaproteobacteria bacterium]
NETINYKVREHTYAKIPMILVVGAREAEQSTVSLRRLGGRKQEVLALDQAVANLSDAAAVPA